MDWLLMIIYFLGLILVYTLGYKKANRAEAYKQGQIDAINGHVYYELVEYEDGSRGWEEIQDNETQN